MSSAIRGSLPAAGVVVAALAFGCGGSAVGAYDGEGERNSDREDTPSSSEVDSGPASPPLPSPDAGSRPPAPTPAHDAGAPPVRDASQLETSIDDASPHDASGGESSVGDAPIQDAPLDTLPPLPEGCEVVSEQELPSDLHPADRCDAEYVCNGVTLLIHCDGENDGTGTSICEMCGELVQGEGIPACRDAITRCY